jgi:CHASE3 domain sensor protein
MTDSTPSPESDPERATMSESAMESVRAAHNSWELAHEVERLSKEAWTLAIKMGDPQTTEGAKVDLDHAGERITEALRIVAITHDTAQGTARALEAQRIQLLMSQAEAGAEQRARATGELMQAANSQAASLKWATWALAGATVVLVLATVVLTFITANA